MTEMKTLAILMAKIAPESYLFESIKEAMDKIEENGGIDNASDEAKHDLMMRCLMYATKIGTAKESATDLLSDMETLHSLHDQMKKASEQ